MEKDTTKGKQGRFFDHYKRKGHTIDQCFMIHGYSDRYKVDNGKQSVKAVAKAKCDTSEGCQDNPFISNHSHNAKTKFNLEITQAIYQQVMKVLTAKGVSTSEARITSKLA